MRKKMKIMDDYKFQKGGLVDVTLRHSRLQSGLLYN